VVEFGVYTPDAPTVHDQEKNPLDSSRREEVGNILHHVDGTAAAPSKRVLLGPALAKPEAFHSRLGKMLVDRELITREELTRALERQAKTGERLGEALVAMGAASSGDVTRVLAEQLRFPYIDLTERDFDPSFAGLITGSVARHFEALPVARWGDKIVIAMAHPNEPGALDELRAIIGSPLVAAMADPLELRTKLEQIYRSETVAPPKKRGIAYMCPECEAILTVSTKPWVMREENRETGRVYIWDDNPASARPVHICPR
jgi:hypothetical protein